MYSDLKKMMETLFDLVVEQSDDIKEVKQKVMAMTSDKPKKRGVRGLALILEMDPLYLQGQYNSCFWDIQSVQIHV